MVGVRGGLTERDTSSEMPDGGARQRWLQSQAQSPCAGQALSIDSTRKARNQTTWTTKIW